MMTYEWFPKYWLPVAILPALLCILLLLSGCGPSGPEDAESPVAASNGDNFELDIKSCGGFGPAEAVELLGLPAGALQDKSQDITENSRWCIYSNPQDIEKGVMFTVSQADSVEKAAVEFQQFRNNAGVAVGVLGEEGDKAHNVEDLGDEALWTPVPGGVYARKGRYSVQVNSPKDETIQIEIAKRIFGEEE